jgi:tocopherol O-methyltransferase
LLLLNLLRMRIQLPTNAPTDGRKAPALTSAAIGNHYDQFAWAYRLFWGDHLHHGLFRNGKEKPQEAQEALLRHCAAQAGLRQESQIVDVGCGHGGTARFLAREYSCSVLGLTISEAQLRLARRLSRPLHGLGSVRFELANAEEYPFPPSSFDVVWNMESLGHFFHKEDYLAKIATALKPGARFMLADWMGSMQDPLVRQIAEAFLCPDLLTAQQYTQASRQQG